MLRTALRRADQCRKPENILMLFQQAPVLHSWRLMTFFIALYDLINAAVHSFFSPGALDNCISGTNLLHLRGLQFGVSSISLARANKVITF
jgi:hypothetical protein